MGTLFIVFVHPKPDYISDMIKTDEEVLVEQLLAVGEIKSLNVSILIRVARLNVLDCHAVGFGPFGKYLPRELGTIISPQYLG